MRSAPGVGGLFGFKFSSRAHPRKFGVKRFLVVREVAGAEVGWPIFGLPPSEKIDRRHGKGAGAAGARAQQPARTSELPI
jgi:hypothetical protein